MTLKRPCFALPLFSKYRLLNTEHNITFTDWSRTNLDFLYILSSYTYMISMEAEIPPTYKRKNFKDKKAKWRTRNPTRVPETPKRGSSPIKTFLFQFLQSSERQTNNYNFSLLLFPPLLSSILLLIIKKVVSPFSNLSFFFRSQCEYKLASRSLL